MRVLGRLLKRAHKSFGAEYSSRIKRRYIEVMNAPNQKRRLAPYKDLLKVTRETILCAEQAVKRLKEDNGRKANLLATDLEHYIELAWRVVSQRPNAASLAANRYLRPRRLSRYLSLTQTSSARIGATHTTATR